VIVGSLKFIIICAGIFFTLSIMIALLELTSSSAAKKVILGPKMALLS
jgi:hypothetical protein